MIFSFLSGLTSAFVKTPTPYSICPTAKKGGNLEVILGK